MVDRYELKQMLDARGVNPSAYYIVGVSPGGMHSAGELVLGRDGDRWVVFRSDRGEEFGHQYFDDEAAAANYLLRKASWTPPPPKRLTAEERERARVLQEQQLEEHRDWLRRQGRDPDTGLPVDQ
jgi:uracil-DNA glycosylase